MDVNEAPCFYFALCQVECQDLLKAEVSARYPSLRLAFTRPGFLTFKAAGSLGTFEPRLALLAGRCFGSAPRGGESKGAPESPFPPPLRVWRHDAERGWYNYRCHAGGWEGSPAFPVSVVSAWIHRVAPGPSAEGLDVFLVDDDRPSPQLWLGRAPAGRPPVLAGRACIPESAPSRAYAKLVEVLDAFEMPAPRGGVALDLGAAPGGASLALLERGMHVITVDPAPIDAHLGERARELGLRFATITKKASALDASDLADFPPVEWLVSDINLAPPVALTQLSHALALVKRSVRSLIVTIKLNDRRALEGVEQQLLRLAKLAGGEVKTLHLPSHRREFAAVVQRR